MNPLRPLIPLQFDQPAPLPGLPPLIQLPPLPQRQVMYAANGIPMLQPGDATNSNVIGHFPDANISGLQDMGALGDLPGPGTLPPWGPGPSPVDVGSEEPMSGYRELAMGNGAEEAASPGVPAQGGPGILDRIINPNALGALGLALTGLGGPQGRSPVLEGLVAKQIQQRQQAGALGPALAVMSAAGQAANATAAKNIYDAALGRPEIRQNWEVSKLLLAARTKVAEQAYKENTVGRISAILQAQPDNATRQQVQRAFAEAGIPMDEQTRAIVADYESRYKDVTGADSRPGTIDRQTGGYTGYGPQKREISGGTIVEPYAETPTVARLPKTITLSPGQREIDIVPGQAPKTIASVPDRPTDLTRRGFELWLGQVPENPTAAQTSYAANVGDFASKMGEDTILKAKAAGLWDRILGTAPGAGPLSSSPEDDATATVNANAAGLIDKQKRQEKIDIAKAAAETTSGLVEQRTKNTENRKKGEAFAVANTVLNQLESLLDPLSASGHLAKDSSATALLKARAVRSSIPIVGEPGNALWNAWQSQSGNMVAIERSLGDIGPRAIAAYKGLMNVIENPTTADAARAAFNMVRQNLEAAQTKEEQAAPPVETLTKPRPVTPPPAAGKVRVIGPGGERGTVPAGTDLSQYPGWKTAP